MSTDTLEPMVQRITDEMVAKGLLPRSYAAVFMPELDLQMRRQTRELAAKLARLGTHLGPERRIA